MTLLYYKAGYYKIEIVGDIDKIFVLDIISLPEYHTGDLQSLLDCVKQCWNIFKDSGDMLHFKLIKNQNLEE